MVIQSNVRGRDLGSFVEEVKERIDAGVKLPTGYHAEYGGTYEHLQSGRARLLLVVPVTFALVFVLLFTTFGSVRQAALVFTGIPFAVTGGILALFFRGMPFSMSAGIGFIALFGVAVLNGVVLLTFTGCTHQPPRRNRDRRGMRLPVRHPLGVRTGHSRLRLHSERLEGGENILVVVQPVRDGEHPVHQVEVSWRWRRRCWPSPPTRKAVA